MDNLNVIYITDFCRQACKSSNINKNEGFVTFEMSTYHVMISREGVYVKFQGISQMKIEDYSDFLEAIAQHG